MTARDAIEGEFPRAIGLFRTSQSYIVQARRYVPNILSLVWFCQYAPDSSTYTPLYIASKAMPRSWMRGAMHKYDPESAWWNFAVVGNYAARFYSFAMADDGLVRKLQRELDKKIAKDVKATEVAVFAMIKAGEAKKKNEKKNETGDKTKEPEKEEKKNEEKGNERQTLMIDIHNSTAGSNSLSVSEQIVELLTVFTCAKGEAVSLAWRNLFPLLLSTYRDGMVVGDKDKGVFTIKKMFYPKWWLESVGYFDHHGNKNGILFLPNPMESKTFIDNIMFIMIILGSLILSSVIGFLVGKSSVTWKYQRGGYIQVGSIPINTIS
jgi:hypothetical protein